jgi:hypothetical protein
MTVSCVPIGDIEETVGGEAAKPGQENTADGIRSHVCGRKYWAGMLAGLTNRSIGREVSGHECH